MIEIRKLNEKDIELANDLLKCWGIVQDKPQAPSNKRSSLPIKERLSDINFHVLVAINKGKVVGGLTAYTLPIFTKDETELFLYEIETLENHRREGIATMLIDRLKQLCNELKVRTIFLCTDLENEAAQALYANTGGHRETVALYTYELSGNSRD
ncbi:MAG: hypothetical protein Aureis2KO_09000 [Aureisphaera sp.]